MAVPIDIVSGIQVEGLDTVGVPIIRTTVIFRMGIVDDPKQLATPFEQRIGSPVGIGVSVSRHIVEKVATVVVSGRLMESIVGTCRIGPFDLVTSVDQTNLAHLPVAERMFISIRTIGI